MDSDTVRLLGTFKLSGQTRELYRNEKRKINLGQDE